MLGALLISGGMLTACDDYLDITPPSKVTPELYFNSEEQLGNYLITYYTGSDVQGNRGNNAFPHYGVGGSSYSTFLDDDQGTDNESGNNNKFFDGDSKSKVGATGGSWNFNYINNINYFFDQVLPKYQRGEIQGADVTIRHYIGEAYLLRANEYFGKLRSLGDFPIITKIQPLDKDSLIMVSKRQPRNKVARFIIEDLDSAYKYLSDGATTGGRNRITKDIALMLKARVALYEATFEKYFAGTPFVPDATAGWPGATKDYNAGFTYDNAAEVSYFLDQALDAAGKVADAHPTLTANNKQMLGSTYTKMPENPYYKLFTTNDPKSMDEALMYRTYIKDVSGGHCLNKYLRGGRGYTQEFANCFLMDNGLPIYAANSGYKGDDFVADTKEGRDWRWRLFMKAPNEYVYEGSEMRIGEGQKNKSDKEYKAPAIINGGTDFTTSSGYTKSKGFSTNMEWNIIGMDITAPIIFRSAEAYLIYLEAAWEKYGDGLNAKAWELWGKLRVRAGLPQDAHVTINATDLAKEEETSHDFALYSGGRRITSPVLYNIRRERRCELISEGMRWDDLIRWRALDQLKTQRYYRHGCKIFGPMLEWFTHSKGKLKKMLYDQSDPNKNNVSSPTDIEGGLNGDPKYFSLDRISSKNDWYDSGYSWRMAHYLDPIAESHFLESTADGTSVDQSPIYQNPYWTTTHDTPALQ